jgi:hypothetical protein
VSDFQTVATFRKNNLEEIRVSVAQHDGYAMVDVRVFTATSASDGEPRPTRQGICIPRTKLRDLVTALRAAEQGAAR